MPEINNNLYPTMGEIVLESLNRKLYEDDRVKTRKPYNEFVENVVYREQSEQMVINSKYNDFKIALKEDLLAECMYKILIPALENVNSNRKYNICKGLVRDFIKEENVDSLLRKFKTGSIILYEMYDLTTKYHNLVLEKVDKKDPNTFILDTEDKDNFFTDLDNSDLNSASITIKERIASSMDDFIIDNMQTKAEVEEIIQTTKERVESTKNEEAKKDIYSTGNSIILEITERKRKTLLEAMVHNVAESSIKNDKMRELYCENNKINMDNIVNDTVVLYGFLEMLNTCKMKNIDESYLYNMLNNLKK